MARGRWYPIRVSSKTPETLATEVEKSEESEETRRSDFSRALEKIKEDTLAAASKRSHLPQPLFWSLFHAQLASLKAEKKAVRELEELFSQKL